MNSPIVAVVFSIVFAVLLLISTFFSINTSTAKFMKSHLTPIQKSSYNKYLFMQVILDIILGILYGTSINYYFYGFIFAFFIYIFFNIIFGPHDSENCKVYITLDDLSFLQVIRVTKLTLHKKIDYNFKKPNQRLPGFEIRYDISEEVKEFSWEVQEVELEPYVPYELTYDFKINCQQTGSAFERKHENFYGDVSCKVHCSYGLLAQDRIIIILPFTRTEAKLMPILEFSLGNFAIGRAILCILSNLVYNEPHNFEYCKFVIKVSENPNEFKYKPSNETVVFQSIKIKGVDDSLVANEFNVEEV